MPTPRVERLERTYAAFNAGDLEEAFDVADGATAAITCWRSSGTSRGAGSGIETERRMGHLWRFEGDRAVESQAFLKAGAELVRRETGSKRE
jgi:hypothetical protein